MNWKTEGLKRFDGIFGRLACSAAKLITTPRLENFSDRPKILVIRPGGIGDAVLLFPALRELRKFYPESVIDVLAEKRNAGIFTLCADINRTVLYDSNPHSSLYSVIRGNYDIVVDTEQWHHMTAAVSYMTGAPVRAGFETNERAELYSHKVSFNQRDYEARSFLNLASAVTGKDYEFQPDVPFVPLNRSVRGDIGSALKNFKKGKKFVVGIFAGATVNERRWGARNFGELAKGLSKDGFGVVLVGGKNDLENSREIKAIAGGGNLLDFTGQTSLSETALIISELDLLVSGDSGLMHIAYGVGTQTVALFGAGIEEKWAPRGKNHVAINKHLSCSPCTKFGYTPTCQIDVKCLGDISVDDVILTVQERQSGKAL